MAVMEKTRHSPNSTLAAAKSRQFPYNQGEGQTAPFMEKCFIIISKATTLGKIRVVHQTISYRT